MLRRAALRLGLQTLASLGVVVFRGVLAPMFWLLWLLGRSYAMADDPNSGVVASFLGFTAGAGFCEEVCKAGPVLVMLASGTAFTWRMAFLWGLAGGAGFGVAEGIMYSSSYYNGIAGPGIYLVRFISCVALHAVWSGAVGISAQQRQELLQEEHESWWMYLPGLLLIVAVSMILHGLYDTLLKKEYPLGALAVAVASFGYLAWVIGRLRSADDEAQRQALLREYARQRVAMGNG